MERDDRGTPGSGPGAAVSAQLPADAAGEDRRDRDRIRVLWLLKEFGLGGAERLLLEILPFLRGIEIHPVSVAAEVGDLVPAVRAAGLEPASLGARRIGDPRWLLRLRDLVRGLRPDLVHVHNPVPAAGVRIAALGLGVPIVYVEQGRWPAYHPLSRVANGLTMPLDAASIAVSDEIRASALRDPVGRFTARHFEVIPNGVDVEEVRRDGASPPSTELPTPMFGSVTHLTRPKGVDVLIRGVARLSARGVRVPCAIVGGGELEAELRALAEAEGVAELVQFLGVRADARSLAARMSVFVLPSRSEGLPLALLEAMALERPIVATRAGGIPEAVSHGEEALLVPPDDPVALADAIQRLFDDPELAGRLGVAAGHRVERDHGAERTAQRLLAVYRRVLRGRR